MATVEIYRGTIGMQKSRGELEERILAVLQAGLDNPRPDGAVTMLQAEERNVRVGLELADLMSIRHVLDCHLDEQFVRDAAARGRETLRTEGAKKVKAAGLKQVEIQLRGGTKLRLFTPYLRPSLKNRPGTRRASGKRGPGGAGLYPVLEALGISLGVTPLTRSVISRELVLRSSYQEAQEGLGRAGLEVPISTMLRVGLNTGQGALLLRDQALERARDEPLPTESFLEGLRVRISLDGGRLRMRYTRYGRGYRPGKNGRRPFDLQWREPRIITIDVLDEEGNMERRYQPIYEVSLGDADEVFDLLEGLLRRVGIHLAEEVLFVADGAEWIWNRVEQLLVDVGLDLGKVKLALDYYHATGHISDALSAVRKLSAKAREQLFGQLRRLLLEPGGAQAVIDRLREFARGRRATAINKELQYLEKHLEHMQYDELRAQNLPIGSGVVESAIRRVVNLRFKSASQCWAPYSPEPLLYLRAMCKSGRWDQFFAALLENRHWLTSSHSPLIVELPQPREERDAA